MEKEKKKMPLVVIVILVIIGLVTVLLVVSYVSSVSNVISESEKTAHKLSLSQLERHLTLECEIADMNGTETPSIYTFNNGVADYEIDINEDFFPDSGTIVLNDNCEVVSVDVIYDNYSIQK